MNTRLLAFTALMLGVSARAAIVLSDFTTDAEGWSGVDLPSFGPYNAAGTPFAASYHAAGGNPDGYVAATDPSSQSFFFEAPSKFLGNQSAFYGGSLRFDLKVDLAGVPVWEEGVEVVLVGAGLTLVRDIGIVPPATWQTFSFNLDESGWTKPGVGPASAADFQSALAALDHLRILGEYASGVVETTALDNVCLVPEPGAAALITALGLGTLVVARRRQVA